jgi:hypothetical protein
VSSLGLVAIGSRSGSLVVGGPWLGWFVSSPAVVCSLDPRNQIKQLLDQDKTKTEREKLPEGPNNTVVVWACAVGLGGCVDVGMVVVWAWAWWWCGRGHGRGSTR